MIRKTATFLFCLALAAGLFGVLPAPSALAGTCTSVADGNWSTGSTWSAGCTGTGGVPASGDSVNVAHIVTLTANTTVGTGTVTVNSGGVLDLVGFTITANTLAINDNGEVKQGGSSNAPAGTVTTRTYSTNSTYTFYGTQAGLSGTHPTYGNLRFAPTPTSGGTFGLNLNVQGNLIIALGNTNEIRFATGSTARTHTINGDLIVESGTLVGNNGTAASTVNLGGDFTINGGTFRGTNDSGNATLNIRGDITNNSTWLQDDGSSTGLLIVALNGTTGSQSVGGTNAISFENLQIDNANGVVLNRSVDLTNLLTLTSGLLTLGGNDLTLGASASIGGTPSAANMIVADGAGSLCKTYGAAGAFTFPIGDNTGGADYSPVSIDYTAGTFPGNACVRVTDAPSPKMPGAATNYVTRYWTASGTVDSPTYDATFTYTSGDIVGTESAMSGKKWTNASPWTTLGLASGNQFTGTGLTGFSQFTAFDTPLAVTLASFEAAGEADRVVVTWETLSEASNAGFNLYRSADAAGPLTLLAYLPSQAPGSTLGAAYRFDDLAVQPGETWWYTLEDVALNGATTLHGPVSATVQGPTAVTLNSVSASPVSAGAAALPVLWVAAAAGLALGVSRRRR